MVSLGSLDALFSDFQACLLLLFVKETNHQCCSCRSIMRNDSEILFLIGPPSGSSEFKWFCTVSPLPNLWVESNSISSPSLAHQN
jgi:hypothetical protein